MATCKDCVHVEVCEDITRHKLSPSRAKEILPILREHGKTCEQFKNRSRFVELPCKIGNKLYLSMESRDKMLNVLGGLYTDHELFKIVPEKQFKQILAEQEQRNNTD